MNNGGAVGGEHAAPGTEYTLQGIMRFLQMEWHNHERLRNGWEIEREELKQRVSKDEGQLNKLRRQVDSLDKQIRMLEVALKSERAKSKAVAAGEKVAEEKTPWLGTSNSLDERAAKKPPLRAHNSFIATEDPDKDVHFERSQKHMSKCLEEITYLLLPPPHPPPPRMEQQAPSGFPQEPQGMTMEDVFRAKGQQNHAASLHQPPNHHPPPAPSAPEMMHLSQATHQPLQAEMMTREPSGHPMTLLSSQFNPNGQQAHFGTARQGMDRADEQFEEFGPPKEEQNLPLRVTNHQQALPDGPDGFIFDDPPLTEGQSDNLQRRPDQDLFPSANNIPMKSPPRTSIGSHRRRSSGSSSMARRRSQDQHETQEALAKAKADSHTFKVKFALRGHLDVVRSVIFTGGGSPSEPEICTAGDDGMIKRWIIPASYGNFTQHSGTNDLDIQSYFTHRGHEGVVTSLAACPASATFATGGRVSGDGWIFSGGQDATVRVWERGRVDQKATLEGHTDAVWAVCVLPATAASVFGADANNIGGGDRVLLASGSADGTIKLWSVSAPPQLASPATVAGSRRGVGGSRRHSVTSGSNFPSSPQPSIATATPFHFTLVHSITRAGAPSPTCISPLSPTGETFVVSFTNAEVIVYDTRTGEEIIGMASDETYDGTEKTGVNAIVATSVGSAENALERGDNDESAVHAATGSSERGGVEGVVVSGHEDQFIRFFDANSGQCTYSMLAHASSISSLSLSSDGRSAVSAGHDASLRFWDLEKRQCFQEIPSHRIMRGEGVCSVVWSQDGRLVVSAGGDGVVKVFVR